MFLTNYSIVFFILFHLQLADPQKVRTESTPFTAPTKERNKRRAIYVGSQL